MFYLKKKSVKQFVNFVHTYCHYNMYMFHSHIKKEKHKSRHISSVPVKHFLKTSNSKLFTNIFRVLVNDDIAKLYIPFLSISTKRATSSLDKKFHMIYCVTDYKLVHFDTDRIYDSLYLLFITNQKRR